MPFHKDLSWCTALLFGQETASTGSSSGQHGGGDSTHSTDSKSSEDAQANDAELELAQEIKTAQQAEITTMQELLQNL